MAEAPIRCPDYVKARTAFFDEAGSSEWARPRRHPRRHRQATRAKGDHDGAAAECRADTGRGVRISSGRHVESTRSWQDIRGLLSKSLQGAFCIIGVSATSTTDLGVTPFAQIYANMGLHAAVANTIIQGQFLREVPWWYGLILAVFIAIRCNLRHSQPEPRALDHRGRRHRRDRHRLAPARLPCRRVSIWRPSPL